MEKWAISNNSSVTIQSISLQVISRPAGAAIGDHILSPNNPGWLSIAGLKYPAERSGHKTLVVTKFRSGIQ
jgi:hypothetical protein